METKHNHTPWPDYHKALTTGGYTAEFADEAVEALRTGFNCPACPATADKERPQPNEAARLVNSRFLDSDYQGKDWEAVRKCLIADIEALLAAHFKRGEKAGALGELELLEDSNIRKIIRDRGVKHWVKLRRAELDSGEER